MKIGVKCHGDVADEEAALGSDFQGVVVELEEAVLFHGAEGFEGIGEVGWDVDAVLLGLGCVVELELAHDGHDDVAAEEVFVGKEDAAINGIMSGLYGLAVVVDVFEVLAVGA